MLLKRVILAAVLLAEMFPQECLVAGSKWLQQLQSTCLSASASCLGAVQFRWLRPARQSVLDTIWLWRAGMVHLHVADALRPPLNSIEASLYTRSGEPRSETATGCLRYWLHAEFPYILARLQARSSRNTLRVHKNAPRLHTNCVPGKANPVLFPAGIVWSTDATYHGRETLFGEVNKERA